MSRNMIQIAVVNEPSLLLKHNVILTKSMKKIKTRINKKENSSKQSLLPITLLLFY
jgi:hypothetical protein